MKRTLTYKNANFIIESRLTLHLEIKSVCKNKRKRSDVGSKICTSN